METGAHSPYNFFYPSPKKARFQEFFNLKYGIHFGVKIVGKRSLIVLIKMEKNFNCFAQEM